MPGALGVRAVRMGKRVYRTTLVELVPARYEKAAMILTSNRGFGEWGEVFGDPVVATALLDRRLHHAVVIPIEGASYRLRKHRDLMPEHVRTNAPIIPPATKRRGRPKGKETGSVLS